VLAVDSVSLCVKPAEIYGFLGLNGAGKTTTIRALLGMIRPSEGSIKVLGQAIGPAGRGPWAKVGHLLESPYAYPELSVSENLEIARRLHGLTDRDATSRAIERLGLASYANRKAGTLSSGNMQRLGLARALLHEPELLILDEPANGLDPAGVIEIRELLRDLARGKGVTVFMSSHILTEVDRLGTRIGIIHKGRLIEELDIEQLEKLRMKRLQVRARNLEGAFISLQSAGFKPVRQNEAILVEDEYAIEHADEIARILVNAGSPPTHLAVIQEELEDHFIKLTGDLSLREGDSEQPSSMDRPEKHLQTEVEREHRRIRS
jgi:ABC-2 type transport system ATP-binding protein